MNEKISLIIPVYNVEIYLTECLESIINQTYKNIEVVLIDDGSTDKSGKICDDYAKKYENVNVIHKQNEGLGPARNDGIKNATGKYVVFIDSDDYIDNDMIEELYINMKRYNVDYVRNGYKKVTNNGKILYKNEESEKLFPGAAAKKELLPRMIGSLPNVKDSVDMSATHCIYDLSIIKKNTIVFPSERELISEDLVFNLEYLQVCNGALIISNCGYNYRTNPESLTKKYRENRFELSKQFYLKIKEKLKEYNYDKSVQLRLCRCFFIHLRMSISQERKEISNKNTKECLKKIKEICNDELVKQIIKTYPISKLNFKARIFIYLIKYRLYTILYYILELGLI